VKSKSRFSLLNESPPMAGEINEYCEKQNPLFTFE
jgi:hypothetical protein